MKIRMYRPNIAPALKLAQVLRHERELTRVCIPCNGFGGHHEGLEFRACPGCDGEGMTE